LHTFFTGKFASTEVCAVLELNPSRLFGQTAAAPLGGVDFALLHPHRHQLTQAQFERSKSEEKKSLSDIGRISVEF